MKLNWGTGIAIFYTSFVVVMVLFVIKAKHMEHSLVVENYYEKDLDYQTHLNKVANSKALAVDLAITQNRKQDLVKFQFPTGLRHLSGTILFFRPSDISKDFEVSVETDEENALVVKTDVLLPGLWRIKVNWAAGGQAFYKEEKITI